MMLPLAHGFFQQGYLTNDIDAALAFYRDRMGIRDVLLFDTRTMSGASASMVALAWCGPVMIELIQSIGAPPPLYAGLLPADDFAIRFHHFGYLTQDRARWMEQRALTEKAGMPVALMHEGAHISYFYADARPQLGHHLEYILAVDEGYDFLMNVPHNPAP